jgi:hypothetical protein
MPKTRFFFLFKGYGHLDSNIIAKLSQHVFCYSILNRLIIISEVTKAVYNLEHIFYSKYKTRHTKYSLTNSFDVLEPKFFHGHIVLYSYILNTCHKFHFLDLSISRYLRIAQRLRWPTLF